LPRQPIENAFHERLSFFSVSGSREVAPTKKRYIVRCCLGAARNAGKNVGQPSLDISVDLAQQAVEFGVSALAQDAFQGKKPTIWMESPLFP
jgi:hypothetical protein